jgi:hypothetical protein
LVQPQAPADEELISQRIAAQEAKLDRLTKRRKEPVQLKL